MNISTSPLRTRHVWVSPVLAVLVSAGLNTSVAHEVAISPDQETELTQDEAAIQYATNLKRLLETQIVPGLKRGVVGIGTGRPRSLAVEVIDDPSPYNVGAKVGDDGALIVRLSLGYLTMHDAALDAVALAAALKQSRALRPYLGYQLRLAQANDRRAGGGEPRQHAVTFAEFARLDAGAVRRLFEQPDWQRARERTEIESLGWVIAYLLVRADSTLAGLSSSLPASAAAARLTAAAGWFPAPPFATAFELAAVVRGRSARLDEQIQVCRAAEFMASGIAGVRADPQWRIQLEQRVDLQRRVAHIASEVSRMRNDADCGPSSVTTL